MTKLSDNHYSRNERRVFAALPKGGKQIDTKKIVAKVYKDEVPQHARQIVYAAMTSLARKVKENREPFVVKKSLRKGPWPISWWLEDR